MGQKMCIFQKLTNIISTKNKVMKTRKNGVFSGVFRVFRRSIQWSNQSIQGIQAEYSVGSENEYFSKVDKDHFHKKVCRENVKKILKIKKTESSVE